MDKKYMRGTTGNAQTDGIIRNLYEALNEVIAHLNGVSDQQKPSDREGSLRIVKQADNTYIVAVKSADGWLVSTSDFTNYPTGFRFQTKLD